jgi:hypothetical protein
MHASGDSPSHRLAKHHLLRACLPLMVPFRSMLLTLWSGPESLAPRAQWIPVYPKVFRHSYLPLSRRTAWVLSFGELPPTTARVRHLRHVFNRQAVMSNQAMGRAVFARWGVDHRDRHPRDGHSLLAILQEHLLEPARARHCRQAAMTLPAGPGGYPGMGRPPGPALI